MNDRLTLIEDYKRQPAYRDKTMRNSIKENLISRYDDVNSL